MTVAELEMMAADEFAEWMAHDQLTQSDIEWAEERARQEADVKGTQ